MGHNVVFVDADDWQLAVTRSLPAHMGKHGPMILLRSGRLSEDVVRRLGSVQLTEGAPDDQLLNHGWILGDTARISWAQQADLDLLPRAPSPGRHHGVLGAATPPGGRHATGSVVGCEG